MTAGCMCLSRALQLIVAHDNMCYGSPMIVSNPDAPRGCLDITPLVPTRKNGNTPSRNSYGASTGHHGE